MRAGSKLLRPYHPGLDVEPWTGHQVADAGDLAANPFDLRQAISEVEAGARGLLEAADYLIAIGGDHTIALPLLRATAARHGPVALVHFDAHLDTWDTYFGAPYTHGTPFRRAVEEGVLALDCSAHVGIRGSLYTGSDLTDDRKLGFATVSTTDVARRGVDDAIDRVRERIGDRPVYVSVDIDVLDPAHAPGTGTPEPGGLTTRELQLILRGLDGLRLAGADIVEVAPAYDHAELTSLAAANVAYELLGLFALQAGHALRQATRSRPATGKPARHDGRRRRPARAGHRRAPAEPACGRRQRGPRGRHAGAQLVVLPELCDSGYVFESEQEARGLASPADDSPTLRQWRDLAAAGPTVIVGGFSRTGHRRAALQQRGSGRPRPGPGPLPQVSTRGTGKSWCSLPAAPRRRW